MSPSEAWFRYVQSASAEYWRGSISGSMSLFSTAAGQQRIAHPITLGRVWATRRCAKPRQRRRAIHSARFEGQSDSEPDHGCPAASHIAAASITTAATATTAAHSTRHRAAQHARPATRTVRARPAAGIRRQQTHIAAVGLQQCEPARSL